MEDRFGWTDGMIILGKGVNERNRRKIKVNGGTSYEILFSSLEPEIQKKLREAENKTTALVPHNYKEPDFISDKTKLTANYRANIVVALQKLRKKYPTKKEADANRPKQLNW